VVRPPLNYCFKVVEPLSLNSIAPNLNSKYRHQTDKRKKKKRKGGLVSKRAHMD
jgi:hypothetical protein